MKKFRINEELRIVKRGESHERECSICNGDVRRKIKGRVRAAAAAEFTPDESSAYAAVYCATCIDDLHAAIHPKTKVTRARSPSRS